MTTTIIQVIFLVSAIALAALVLLQQSKSSGLGASFGGSSSSVFGARGAGDFLYSTTRILATIFFLSAIALGYSQNKAVHSGNILERSIEKTATTLDVPLVNKDNASPVLNTDIPKAPQKDTDPKAP